MHWGAPGAGNIVDAGTVRFGESHMAACMCDVWWRLVPCVLPADLSKINSSSGLGALSTSRQSSAACGSGLGRHDYFRAVDTYLAMCLVPEVLCLHRGFRSLHHDGKITSNEFPVS